MRFIFFTLSIIMLLGIPLFLFTVSRNQELNTFEGKLLSPLASPVKKALEVFSAVRQSHLEKTVQSQLSGSEGMYTIVVKNLKTGESYSYNQEEIFETASLYKLWIMAVTFKQIEEGRLKETQVMHDDIAKLNDKFDIATESAEKTEGEITLSIDDALAKMITLSDNYAALLLSSRVRLSNVSRFLKEEGFKNSNIGTPPKTTAQDIASFFEKLYKGEIVSASSSAAMVEILKRQQINDRLPKYLPKDIEVAHKTGELGGFKHDAGIIFSSKGDYILVVFSKSNDPKGAAERIAQISKSVYEYFQR